RDEHNAATTTATNHGWITFIPTTRSFVVLGVPGASIGLARRPSRHDPAVRSSDAKPRPADSNSLAIHTQIQGIGPGGVGGPPHRFHRGSQALAQEMRGGQRV